MKNRLLVYENLHVPFWLLKDSCWALQLKTLGVLLAFPTLLLSFIVVYKTRNNYSLLLPNLAITFWILANSIWMADEFYNLKLHWLCYTPFGIGIMLIFYWLIFYFPKMWKEG